MDESQHYSCSQCGTDLGTALEALPYEFEQDGTVFYLCYACQVIEALEGHGCPLESLNEEEQERVGNMMMDDADPDDIAHAVLKMRGIEVITNPDDLARALLGIEPPPGVFSTMILLKFANDDGTPRLGSIDQPVHVSLN